MSTTIYLFGATGYTGGLVMEALRTRGARPVLVGRRQQALSSLGAEHGDLDYLVCDAADPVALKERLEPGDVVVSTVGPFERYGFPIARAAAEAGAHYVDSTGEVGFVRDLQARLGEVAQRTGSIMLPAFGYDYVPGILAGTLAGNAAAEQGTPATTIDVGYFFVGDSRGAISQGTRSTIRDGLTLPAPHWHDGRMQETRMAARTRAFDVQGRRTAAILAPGTESLFLPETFPQLQNVDVFNGWFPKLARLAVAGSAVSHALLRVPGGKGLIERATRPMVGAPGGPDAEVRARSRSYAVAVASAETGKVAEVAVEGPSAYSLTGETMAWAAQKLSTDPPEIAGVLGPVQAFGLQRFQEGCAEIGLRQV